MHGNGDRVRQKRGGTGQDGMGRGECMTFWRHTQIERHECILKTTNLFYMLRSMNETEKGDQGDRNEYRLVTGPQSNNSDYFGKIIFSCSKFNLQNRYFCLILFKLSP